MILSVRESSFKPIEVDVKFPFYRYCSLNKYHACYCKFESINKICKIEENGNETTVSCYNSNEDVVKLVATEDMLRGNGGWAIIGEEFFDDAFNRLVKKVGEI